MRLLHAPLGLESSAVLLSHCAAITSRGTANVCVVNEMRCSGC